MMRTMRIELLVLLAVFGANSRHADAFAIVRNGQGGISKSVRSGLSRNRPFSDTIQIRMSDDDKDPVFITTVLKKEIAYDEKTGRFFETGYGEGDCVPDEEFCMLDKETGESIRLTVEEKERIFLDSLQVRTTVIVNHFFLVFCQKFNLIFLLT